MALGPEKFKALEVGTAAVSFLSLVVWWFRMTWWEPGAEFVNETQTKLFQVLSFC